MWTQIRLLLQEQSDLCVHCLKKRLLDNLGRRQNQMAFVIGALRSWLALDWSFDFVATIVWQTVLGADGDKKEENKKKKNNRRSQHTDGAQNTDGGDCMYTQPITTPTTSPILPSHTLGVYPLSGRVLDSRSRGFGFEPHLRHCILSLSKTH